MNSTVSAVAVALLAAFSVSAQVVAGLGGISGVVQDQTGAVVPNAKISVANPSKGIQRTLTSNEAGVFTAPALPPSTGYAINVQADGFAPYAAREIQVFVGQNVNLNVELQVAQTAVNVEVSAIAPVIEDTKTDVSQVVTQTQIDNLPINGRRVDTFVLLTPGVVSDGTFGLVSFRGTPGGNTFLTDGNDTTNQYYGENAGRTRIPSQISQDAVQEFQVLTAGYSAEYGRATGGVINTVTRSGENDVHGTAFWFFRNRSLNARDRYAAFNPPEYRHQFGGSLSGPIVKDKLFYFFNTELTRRNFPIASSTFRAGVVENGDWVNCQATAAQCGAIAPLLQPFFGAIPRDQKNELAFGKIDWRPGERHSLSASFNYLKFVSPNGIQTGAAITNGGALTSNGLTTVRDRYGRLSHTFIATSSMVNEARFGWFKDRQADELGGYTPAFGLLSVSVNGVNIGIPNYLPRINPSENRYQFADTLTWTRGRHTLKFGFDIASTTDYINTLFNQYGSYSYGTVGLFAQDFGGGGSGRNYQSYSQTFGNPISEFTLRDHALFAQDQFRINQNLTVNLGLRYDYTSLPTPKVSNPDYPQTAKIREDKNNFSPRAGIAYRIDATNTVIRAGYGISYGRYTGGFLNTLLTNNNVYTKQVTINNTPATPNLAGPAFPNRLVSSELPGGTTSITFAASDLKTPYTQNGDIGIEQKITDDIGLTLSYIWSRGMQFFTTRDLNIGAPGPALTYSIADRSGNITGSYTTPTYLSANRLDRRYLRVNQIENGGRTYYDGLSVQVNKRYSKGFQLSVAYTWSHAIDTALGGGGDNVFFSSGPTTFFPGDYAFDKGDSILDQRHRAAISFVWQPKFNNKTDLLSRIFVNGWQLSSVTTLATPQKTTPTVNVTGSPVAGAAFTGNLNGFGGSARVPFLPRGSVDIDPITRVDARLAKQFSFTERMKLSLLFEAFNVTNSQYDTIVETRGYNVGTDRILRPNDALGSGIASGGFPDGTNARRAQVGARFEF
jgi:outer membrane receptor protein involved in Fe transport